MVETIQWTDAGVVMIDQTRLPLEETFVTCRTYEEVAAAIKDMIIRGAPAIGVAAAMGVALGVLHASAADLDAQVETICDTLARTRPTAVNLFWAIDRMKRLYAAHARPSRSRRSARRLVEEAQARTRKRTSPSTAPSAATARRWCPPRKRSSPTATPEPSPPPATAPRSE